jgi:glycosyltransferase involved in cell wall biosynthesis
MAVLPGYRKFRARVRHTLGPVAHRLQLSGAYRGNVDGVAQDEIVGWAVRSASSEGGLSVGLFVSDGMVLSATADRLRGDVQAAGIGNGRCGFGFPIDQAVRKAAAKDGGVVTVRVLGPDGMQIGSLRLPNEGSAMLPEDGAAMDGCRKLLFGDCQQLLSVLATVDPAEKAAPPALAKHDALFETQPLIPTEGRDALVAANIPAYMDYVRHRYHQDAAFDTDGNPEERDHFLNWYLSVYATSRGEYRVPLAAADIAYLNETMVMGGFRKSLTRAMWWWLLKRPEMLNSLDLNNDSAYLGLVYWWAWKEARAIGAEDCLVTRQMVDLLAGVHASRRNDEFPMSFFVDPFWRDNPQFHFLNMAKAQDRQLFMLSLLVMAVRRPDVLRYIPRDTLARLLDRPAPDQPALLEQFLARLAKLDVPPLADRAHYTAALGRLGYDVERQAFLTFTARGDRLHAAALPVPRDGKEVDVQIIGPFEKASGLGQATRLSAAVLEETGLSVNLVNFGLDNPAAEGFNKVGKLAEFCPARVNIIHLNAESVPLLYAYGPDVLSNSYNIGYFYWELSSPASCHYLAMDLLDEVWVSTEYGVSIYAPETGKPVTNVGMSFEALPPIDRTSARALTVRSFDLAGDEFVFFVAFDSFSFVQRKNPIGVIRAFQQAFPEDERVCLAIKTQNRNNLVDPVQHRMWARIEAMAARDPRLRIVYDTLPYEEVLALKKGSDCYVSLHRSEGWGFGMIEAMNLRVPVICTAFSGNMDFCSDETAWLVGYQETTLMPEDYLFVRKGQVWADPDLADAARQMRAVWQNKAQREARAEAAWQNVQANFSLKAIGKRYETRLRQILKDNPGLSVRPAP